MTDFGYVDQSPQSPTLRDQFAMAVIAGMYACPTVCGTREELAGEAFRVADAMLAARKEAK